MELSVLLTMLKYDLQMTTTANDTYLQELLTFAKSQMEKMGIVMDGTDDSEGMIQVHFASYLFRKRSGEDTAMPRFLQRELNNLLLSQKMKTEEVAR